jgi:hypothetical protein
MRAGAPLGAVGVPRRDRAATTTPDPVARTRHRDERLFAVLNSAQYLYEEKAKAWAMIRSGRSDVDVFAELPAALVGAIVEQLTAR